jgi:signal transduction histidine kinase
MRLVSIQKRILLWFLLLQGVLLISGVLSVLLYARKQQLKAFDADLHGRMRAMVAQTEDHNGALEVAAQDMIPLNHLYVMRSSKGSVVTSRGLENRLANPEFRQSGAFHDQATDYRGAFWQHVPLLDEDHENRGDPVFVDLFYAMPASHTNAHLHRMILAAAFGTIGFLLLSALGTWWAIVRGLGPLKHLADRAAAIDATNWRFEVPPEALRTSELAPLGNALHQLMARLKAAFDRERRFVSDASHELKTAVAIQKSTLQLLEQGERTVPAYKRGIARALEDTERTEKLVQSMLKLAASESPEIPPGTSILADSLAVAAHELEGVAEKLNVKVAVNDWQLNRKIVGDPGELATVWRNLLENALQHSPPGSEVKVTVNDSPDSTLEIGVTDSGPGFNPKDLPRVFDRFYRADDSRARKTGGFGLGLAIAKSLVEKNAGSIEIGNIPSGGASVIVRLAVPPGKTD